MRNYNARYDGTMRLSKFSAENMADAVKQAQDAIPVWLHDSITFEDDYGMPVMELAPGTHAFVFDSTGDAYDDCQCRDDIKRGDILLIPKEDVIGIADTWPFAVSATSGDLHTPTVGWLENPVYTDAHEPWSTADLKAVIKLACSKAVADLLVTLS